MKFTKFILYLFIHGIAYGSPAKIWIDTDIATGRFGEDVDDGIALIMALRSPQLEIKGISLISNTDYGYRVCRKLMEWYGDSNINIPVYKGARNYNQLGTTNSAVEALANALIKEKLSIIALGPATNIANLLLLHPELKDQIVQIIWCAGRRPDQHFSPGKGRINVCDCNFDHDPQAGAVLLNSGLRIVLSGYEPASSISISTADILPLKGSQFKRDRWMYKRLKNWIRIWTFLLGSTDGFIPFDAVTLGSFLYPELTLVSKEVPAVVKSGINDSLLRFFKTRKPYLIASPILESTSLVDYCLWMDPSFKAVILDLLVCKKENLMK